MRKHFLGTIAWLFLINSVVFSQGISRPRNVDEGYAWRLHDQYVASQNRRSKLQAAIRQESANPESNPRAAARLKKMIGQLTAEVELQQRLEEEWSRKFYDRFGDLKDSAETIYDATLNKTFDRIEFRLIYFPFYPNDGTYTGPIFDVPGEIMLVIDGTTVAGIITGSYLYRAGPFVQSEQFNATIDGTLGNAGVIKATLAGNVGRAPFNGSLEGRISNGVASGTWAIAAMTTQCGTFTATRNRSSAGQ